MCNTSTVPAPQSLLPTTASTPAMDARWADAGDLLHVDNNQGATGGSHAGTHAPFVEGRVPFSSKTSPTSRDTSPTDASVDVELSQGEDKGSLTDAAGMTVARCTRTDSSSDFRSSISRASGDSGSDSDYVDVPSQTGSALDGSQHGGQSARTSSVVSATSGNNSTPNFGSGSGSGSG